MCCHNSTPNLTVIYSLNSFRPCVFKVNHPLSIRYTSHGKFSWNAWDSWNTPLYKGFLFSGSTQACNSSVSCCCFFSATAWNSFNVDRLFEYSRRPFLEFVCGISEFDEVWRESSGKVNDAFLNSGVRFEFREGWLWVYTIWNYSFSKEVKWRWKYLIDVLDKRPLALPLPSPPHQTV